MNGKGDDRRPIDEDKFKQGYERIFGKKEVEELETPSEPFHIRNAKHMIKRQEEWEEQQKKEKRKREAARKRKSKKP